MVRDDTFNYFLENGKILLKKKLLCCGGKSFCQISNIKFSGIKLTAAVCAAYSRCFTLRHLYTHYTLYTILHLSTTLYTIPLYTSIRYTLYLYRYTIAIAQMHTALCTICIAVHCSGQWAYSAVQCSGWYRRCSLKCIYCSV